MALAFFCALVTPRRASAEPVVGIELEGRGQPVPCLSLERLAQAFRAHTALPVHLAGDRMRTQGEALVWIAADTGGVNIGIELGRAAVRRTFETAECGMLPEVIAAFVATTVAELEEELPREPMARALVNLPRVRRAAELQEKLRTLILLDARDIDDIAVHLSPRPRGGWRLVVGSAVADCNASDDVLDLPERDAAAVEELRLRARSLVERLRACGPAAFPQSRELQALRLYSYLHVADKRNQDISPTPLTAIYAAEVGLFSLVLSGAGEQLTQGEQFSLAASGGLMLVGGTLPLFFYRESDDLAGPIAETSYLLGAAGVAFTLAKSVDGPHAYSPPLLLLGASLVTAGGLTVAQAITSPRISPARIDAHRERLDTATERNTVTEEELLQIEADIRRYGKRYKNWRGKFLLGTAAVSVVISAFESDRKTRGLYWASAAGLCFMALPSLQPDAYEDYFGGKFPKGTKLILVPGGIGLEGKF
jgi:hypothetical protein